MMKRLAFEGCLRSAYRDAAPCTSRGRRCLHTGEMGDEVRFLVSQAQLLPDVVAVKIDCRYGHSEQFGDFLMPYPTRQPDAPIDREDTDFVNYMTDVEPGYAQRHPDEAWAEAFACWLDPASNWRQRYAAGTGARAKLDYIDRLSKESLAATPTDFDLGVPRERRAAYSGQTVRQALGIAEDDRKIDLSSQ